MLPITGTYRSVPTDLPELDATAADYARQVTGLPVGAARRRQLRAALAEAALAFATRLAKRYRNRGEPLEDLEQVARLGLLHAIDRYDPQRGPFTAFATVTILGELRRHFRDRTWGVHVPRRMQELTREVTRTSAELTAQLHRRPTVTELADRLQTTPEEIRSAQETAGSYASVSLNAPRGPDSDQELIDQLGRPDADLDRVEDRLTVSALLCRLPARERQILAMRFYGNRTQAEIATELGISQMHVSRLLSRALTWLRAALLTDRPQHWTAGTVLLDTPQLVIRTRRVAGSTVLVEPIGEVDRDTAGQLREALLAAVRQSATTVRLHLAGVSLIDAAGISALLVGLEAARGAGLSLRITGAAPHVARALRVVGLVDRGSAT